MILRKALEALRKVPIPATVPAAANVEKPRPGPSQ